MCESHGGDTFSAVATAHVELVAKFYRTMGELAACVALQAWQRLLGHHNGTPQPQPSVTRQAGMPSVHDLGNVSAFASPATLPPTPSRESQPTTPQPGTAMPEANHGSQPGAHLSSRQNSSAGLSAQQASPHRTRITSDTAKSLRSVESVPASEIQWLLQAMGSALDHSDFLPPAAADGAQAAVNASPATAADIPEGSERGGKDRVNRFAVWQRRIARSPVPCTGAAAEAEPAVHPEVPAPSRGLHVGADTILGWDVNQLEESDRCCEDLLMKILQESSKVDADVKVCKSRPPFLLPRVRTLAARVSHVC